VEYFPHSGGHQEPRVVMRSF